MSSVMSIAGMISPTVFTLAFSQFIGPWKPIGLPGAPFLLSSALMVIALAFALRIPSLPLAVEVDPGAAVRA